MAALGQNPTEVELLEMVSVADSDNDGTINFPEFTIMMSKVWKEENPENEAMEAFKAYDLNRDGYISAAELKTVVLSFFGRRTILPFAFEPISEILSCRRDA